jgi:hypothetical protein
MTIPEETFVDRCLQGEALISEIDDFVDRWHDAVDEERSLAEFLGLTESEYALWVKQPSALKLIIFAKKNEVPLEQLLRFSEGHAMAARAASPEEVNAIVKWLKETKRIP